MTVTDRKPIKPLPVQRKPAASRRRNPLMHAAKISGHRFRRVLWHFVRDHTASETARAVDMSINSVHALFRKLRIFFYDVHLFRDFYDGRDPETVDSGDPVFEQRLLEYHLARYGRHRGFRSPATEPPHHFAETCWRYDFQIMMNERPSDAVYGMMQRHLLELIRLCGPVGAQPRNLLAGARAVMRQTDERIDWFRRNAPGFRDAETRRDLFDTLAIREDPV